MFLGEKGPGDLSAGWPRCCAPSRCEGTQVPLGLQSVRSHFPEHKEIPAELDLQCADAMDAVCPWMHTACSQPCATATPFGVSPWPCPALCSFPAVFRWLRSAESQNSIVCSFQCVEEIGRGLFSLPQMKKLPS